MPDTKSSDELRNNFDEISSSCRQSEEPVFVTENGKADLVVLSRQACGRLAVRLELYGLLQEGLEDVKTDNTRSLAKTMASIRAARGQER